MKFDLLIAEDDGDMARLLAELAHEQGFACEVAGDAGRASQRIARNLPDAVLTDLRLPGGDGMQLLALAREHDPRLPVVLITGYATPQNAVQAFQQGVFDIILKPFETDQVKLLLRRVRGLLEHRQRILQLSAQLAARRQDSIPEASSAEMRRALALSAQVAGTNVPVLLQGETGVGKGVLAEHIHASSPRAADTFLAVNCGAITPTLIESELFGHEKGAFTGASARRIGLLELAHGGTLFLDEINSAPAEVQTRLLKFIQDRSFFRVGGARPVEVDVRLVFAANVDLAGLVAKGAFRQDLFYRLNVFPIRVPPLRERREDIPVLAEFLLVKHAREINKPVKEIERSAINALCRYDWPGNVRELENVIQRAIVLAAGDTITQSELPRELVAPGRAAAALPWADDATLAEVERAWILEVLERHGGNRTRAARALGIDPSTLWRKLKEYGAAPPLPD